jgi:hypothetical protein
MEHLKECCLNGNSPNKQMKHHSNHSNVDVDKPVLLLLLLLLLGSE